MSERNAAIVWLVALVAMAAFVAARFEVTTDVGTFLPDDGREQHQMMRAVAESELSRTLILSLGAPTDELAAQASRALERALLESQAADDIAFIDGGPPENIEETIWTTYFERRFYFAEDSAAEAAASVGDEALQQHIADLRRQLEQPMSPLLTRLIPADPMLWTKRLFDRVQGSRGGDMRIFEQRFLSVDGPWAILFVGTKAPAFDAPRQALVLEALQQAFDHVNDEFGGELSLDRSGAHLFAVRTEATIRRDVRRVTIVSILGLTLLVGFLFRSPRLLALSMLPVAAGVLSGAACTLAFWGRIHGITLAFGASLLGVAIDYVVHLYCQHAEAPSGTPQQTLERIWRPIAIGAATTLAGFLALGGSGFRALSEVAAFSVAGIIAAVATTRWIVPSLMPQQIQARRLRTQFADALLRALNAGRNHRPLIAGFALAGLVFACLMLPRVGWNTSFASFASLDADLVREDERVRGRLAHLEQSRFVLSVGDDDEAALQVNDMVHERLSALDDSVLGGFRGVGRLLPSQQKQAAIAESIRTAPALWERLSGEAEAQGFRREALAPFQEALSAPLPAPLRWEDLAETNLAPLVRPFHVTLGDRVGYVSFLHDVGDPDVVRDAVAGIEDASFVDQGAVMGEANRVFQRRALLLLIVGLAVVFVILVSRYRDLRRAAAAFVPAVLAACVTVATLTAVGVRLDLISLTALLMVVSIGVDYGVFLVDAEAHGDRDVRAALLSVSVACVSTVLGFGVLALSKFPILFSIGLTAGVGVTTSALLAPAALLLIRRHAEEEQSPT